MIHLAFCITELNIGGAEQALTELAIRIDKTRFSVMVYSLQPKPENEQTSCVGRLEKAGIPVYFLNMKGFRSFPSALLRLKTLLRRQRPDIFLSFLFHANFLGRLAARWAGVPHVVSGIRVAEKKAGWHLALDRRTSFLVDRYLCVSRSVAEFSQQVGRLPPEKLVVIPNGVDIPTTLAAQEEDRILFVGRLTYQKGLDWLLETTPDWLGKLPDTELWLVGEGEERKNLVDQLAERKFDDIRDRIRFAGWRKDAAELLAASKLVVLPSRWEGMPNVLLQAMAAARPVVAADSEGVAELLGPSAARQTCSFGDSNRLTELILTITNDSGLAAALGASNRMRVAEHFSLDNVVRQYERFFESF